MTISSFIPSSWQNQNIILYHGTIEIHVASILNRIDVNKGSPYSDFGRGFYTTTIERQASSWAWQISRQIPGSSPAVIQFEVNRDALSALECLCFVRGSFDAEDFWSFVFHCRRGNTGHQRTTGKDIWYDVVIGPVAAFWNQRLVLSDSDQFGFHTDDAADLLNQSNPQRIS